MGLGRIRKYNRKPRIAHEQRGHKHGRYGTWKHLRYREERKDKKFSIRRIVE